MSDRLGDFGQRRSADYLGLFRGIDDIKPVNECAPGAVLDLTGKDQHLTIPGLGVLDFASRDNGLFPAGLNDLKTTPIILHIIFNVCFVSEICHFSYSPFLVMRVSFIAAISVFQAVPFSNGNSGGSPYLFFALNAGRSSVYMMRLFPPVPRTTFLLKPTSV